MRRTRLVASLIAVTATTIAVDDPLPFALGRARAMAQAPADTATEPPEPLKDEAPPDPSETPATPVPAPVPVPASAPETAPGEKPVPSPAPPLPVPPVPLVPPEFAAIGPGEFAAVVQVQPAHRVAMMEAGREVPETDPLVARASVVLTGLTAKFLEDAPRIADVSIRTTAAIRKAKGAASPLELMEAALNSKRPADAPAIGPRRFDAFATRYRKARIEQGKDHAAALRELQRSAAPGKKPH